MAERTDLTAHRRAAFDRILAPLSRARRIALTTHVNADGDGVGSQAALSAWLSARGAEVTIVNPTPFPAAFRFLFDDDARIADAGTAAADTALAGADLLVVLDTAEPKRIGRLARTAASSDVIVIDHHVAGGTLLEGEVLQDVSACATGELVYDLLVHAGFDKPWPRQVIEGIYAAVVTDTGSFRFSNTTLRAHEIAGDLITMGVDPELMYRRIYATVPLRRIELLRYALQQLELDARYPITWISIERGIMEELQATSEDLDGVIEHARSIEGTEVAILFRETTDRQTKISFRSAGAADVNTVARRFGGGGHVKASGALVPEPLTAVRPRVLQATREALDEAGLTFRASRADP